MEFGMSFFPDVRPEQKPAAQYFDEALRLVSHCDIYGYTHVRIVEHYFHAAQSVRLFDAKVIPHFAALRAGVVE